MAWGNITFFQSSGKTPSFSIDWKIRLNGRAMDLPQSLIIRIDMLSHPYALSTNAYNDLEKLEIFSVHE